MREIINVIKHCSFISFVFLILTYLTTVNIEGKFISVDSVWISNNFLVTLFGGVFASMLVVVLCEIQKYLSAKTNTEHYLFYQSVYLYQALVQMKINAKDYIEHQELQIPENLFDESIRMIQSELIALQTTDYATFIHGKDSFMVKHGIFRVESLPKIQSVLQTGILLRIAINQTIKENLEMQLETHIYTSSYKQITSQNPRIDLMLNKAIEALSLSATLVERYIVALDNCCNNKFKWDEIKEKLPFSHLEDNNIYSQI